MGDEAALAAKKALQTEIVAVKTRWGDEVKLTKAKQDSPTYPLPIGVLRVVEKPQEAYLYDVEDIKVRLWIDELDQSKQPIRVDVTAGVPDALLKMMSAHIEARWKAELNGRGAGTGWLIEKILAWCQAAYIELITLEPRFVEMYQGCDENGMTIRRYAISEPPEEKSSSQSEEEDIEQEVNEPTPEEIERLRQLRIKEKAQAEADRLWREERRKEAEKLGEDAVERQRAIGKKEQVRRCPATP